MKHTKRLMSIILSIVMLLSITAGLDFSAYANIYSGKCGKNVTWTLNTATKTLTISGKGAMDNYVMYEETPPYSAYEPTDLRQYYVEAENLIVEEGVTSIGECAFMCSRFKNILLPNTLKVIGRWAFYDSDNYKTINLPKSLQKIGKSAFYGNRLSEIIIPKNVTSIGEMAFVSYEKSTKKIVIPLNVNSIGKEAFGYYLDEEIGDPQHLPIPNVKIYGYSGTQAEKYAKSNKIKFVSYTPSVQLSKTSYTYDGKVKKPSVTVKNKNGKTISSKYYTVSYSKGRKNVGQYTVTIKFKGNYSGTVKKTFTIKPKATTISKVTAGKKAFTVKWKKQTTQTTGYQIQYSTSSKFKSAKTVTVSKNKTTSKKISKLKAKKKYYVRIRTYKTVKVNGKNTKIYSGWSKAKTVKTK